MAVIVLLMRKSHRCSQKAVTEAAERQVVFWGEPRRKKGSLISSGIRKLSTVRRAANYSKVRLNGPEIHSATSRNNDHSARVMVSAIK